jgi:hypothetical protein
MYNGVAAVQGNGWVYPTGLGVYFTEQEWQKARSSKPIDKVCVQRGKGSYEGVHCFDEFVKFV